MRQKRAGLVIDPERRSSTSTLEKEAAVSEQKDSNQTGTTSRDGAELTDEHLDAVSGGLLPAAQNVETKRTKGETPAVEGITLCHEGFEIQ